MCDYSLKHLASRPAKVGDKLTVSAFRSTASIGFVAADAEGDKRQEVVCVLPGTELAFDTDISVAEHRMLGCWSKEVPTEHRTARFRQVNTDTVHTHHDALELPDGKIAMLNNLAPGQTATVLQLPAAPKTADEAKAQARLEVVA
jgi:hypothetical protein